MIEGSTVVIDVLDELKLVGNKKMYDMIDRLINQGNLQVTLIIPMSYLQKQAEELLITQHHPMLAYIAVGAVKVVNSPFAGSVIISSRAIRFTNWSDMERYFI